MLYVDSADLRQITRLLATGLFDGVTCNPSILAAAGRGFGDLPALYSAATGAGAHLFFAQRGTRSSSPVSPTLPRYWRHARPGPAGWRPMSLGPRGRGFRRSDSWESPWPR